MKNIISNILLIINRMKNLKGTMYKLMRKIINKKYINITMLIALLLLLSGLSLRYGASKNADKHILLISRLPRLISVVAAGAGMSIAGIIMQQISSNKFVSPTTAATIDSAQLGVIVSLMVVPGCSTRVKMVGAFTFSVIGSLIFLKVLKAVKIKNAVFIPLIGIMLGNVIGSLSEFIAYKYNLVQSLGAFFQGKFSMILKGNYEALYMTIPLIIIAYLYANKFTIAGMGEDISSSLGLDYNKICNIGMILVSLITSLIVITAGNIPFVGLIIPNIVSIYKGDNIKENLGITALCGAIFVLVCDIISRIIIYPYEVSVSLTVGVIGSIVFLYLIMRRNSSAG